MELTTSLATVGPLNNDSAFFDRSLIDEVCQRLHTYAIFQGVINIVVVGILIILGWIGNTLSLIVLLRSDNSNRTVNFLLQALAVADNMYLLACFFLYTLRSINTCTGWLYYYPYFEQYAWAFAAIAQTTAVWIVVLVTADRYIALCHPFKVSCLCTLKRAIAMVCTIVFVAILYNLPRFFEHTVVYDIDLCKMEERYVSISSDLLRNRTYFIVYKTFMYFIFRLLFPLITLFILNTKLILVLKTATKSHASLTKTNPKKDSVTKVLVIVVTVFLICEVPDAILRILAMLSHLTSFHMDEIKLSYANTITNMLLAVNSSVNCLIYSLTGKTFRKRLQRLFTRGCRRSHPQYTYPGSEDRNTACLMNKMQPATGGRTYNGTTGCEVNTSSSLVKETSIR